MNLCGLCDEPLTDENSTELTREYGLCSKDFHAESTAVFPHPDMLPGADEDEEAPYE